MASWIFLTIFLVGLVPHALPELVYPGPKNWWAKKITADLYTGGRLTEEQVKYAHETGFRTIISLFTFTKEKKVGADIYETIPRTTRERNIAEKMTDMNFYVVLKPGHKNWAQMNTVKKFTKIYKDAPKPVFFHCGNGFASSFVALMYLAKVYKEDSTAEPPVDINEVLRRGAGLGYDYTATKLLQLASNITGDAAPDDPTKPDILKHNWYKPLWYFKPILKNWFISGQIRDSYIYAIGHAKYKTVVNVREGIENKEEVPLLNIQDGTGTYEDGGRQTRKRLLATRIDPDKPNSYVYARSKKNYLARNPHCFGDDVGYNEVLERKAVKKEKELRYIHLPVPKHTNASLAELWQEYHPKLLNASESGPVIVHCDDLYRSGMVALLAAGQENKMSAAWAEELAEELGLGLSKEQHPGTFQLFNEVLGSAASTRTLSLLIIPVVLMSFVQLF